MPLFENHTFRVATFSSVKYDSASESFLVWKAQEYHSRMMPRNKPRAQLPSGLSSSSSVQSSLTGLVPAFSQPRPSRYLVRAQLSVRNASLWTNLSTARLPSSLIGCARSRMTDTLIYILRSFQSCARARALIPGLPNCFYCCPSINDLKQIETSI